ncbi:MAG: hypothetical protein L0H26_09660 [Microlunatus sp.]|nr:hypothetical protein [Microlunatus sp.]
MNVSELSCPAPTPPTGNVTFSLTATNSAGTGAAATTTLQVLSRPGAVKNLQVTPNGNNNSVDISFTPGDLNGATPDQESYTWNAGGRSGPLVPGLNRGITDPTAFQNGSPATVTVTTTTNDRIHSGVVTTSPPVTSSYQVYGPPTAPNISTCTGGYQEVTCWWDGNGQANGSPTTYQLIYGMSGAVSGSGGSKSVGLGYGASSGNVCVQASQSLPGGGTRTVTGRCGSASSWAAPALTVVNAGGSCQASWFRSGVVPAGCVPRALVLARYRPGSTMTCSTTGVGLAGWTSYPFGIDGNGNGSAGPKGSGGLYLVDTTPYRFVPSDFSCS